MKESRSLGIWSPLKVFTVLALTVGLIFIFLTPPYQVSDEDNHFYRAYQISELDFQGHKTQQGPGGVLPQSLKITKDSFDYLAQTHTHKVKSEVMNAGLSKPLNSHDKIPISFPNTVLYQPLAYIPQAVGIGALRQFEVPPLVLMYTARLLNFVAWFLLVYAAIKITTIGKWAFCVLALMPMSLFTAASMSADAAINGLSFLAVALFFRYVTTRNILVSRDYLAMLGVSIGLALCKPPYLLLASLFLILPIAKFKSKKSYWLFAGCLVLAISIAVIGWSTLTKGLYANYRITYDLTNGQLIHAHQQAAFIIQKPFDYVVALYNTYFTAEADARGMGYIGMLGWLTFLPLWSVILNYGLIAVSLGLLTGTEEKNLIALAKWRKLIIAAIGIAAILGFSTLAYLTYTPLGKSMIDGVQGRYFIPLSVLLVAFFAFKPRSNSTNYQKLCIWTTLAMSLILVTSIIVIFFRYYIPSAATSV